MVFANKNITRRLQLLREERNRLLTYKNNGYKLTKEEVDNFNKDLTYCKQLVREQLSTCNISNI